MIECAVARRSHGQGVVSCMTDQAAFTAGARAGRQLGRELASVEQLQALADLQQLSDTEMFATLLLASETYYALFPQHDGDEHTSWTFWHRLAEPMVSRDFMTGFIDGTLAEYAVAGKS